MKFLITRTGLRDEEADVVPEDGRVAIEEIGRQVDHDGQFGQLLEQLAGGDGAVVARAAANQQQPAAAADLGQVVLVGHSCNPFSSAYGSKKRSSSHRL